MLRHFARFHPFQQLRSFSLPQVSVPREVKLKKDKKVLEVTWDLNGATETFSFPAEILRVESPSAEVRGHHPSERQLVDGKKDVQIVNLVPTGNYAIAIHFDDMHNTGIYTWEFLYDLGKNLDQRTEEYFQALQAAGKTRERPARRSLKE